ncbi:MAG: hypothetical protein ACI4VP_04555 [Clostridia bacterium]
MKSVFKEIIIILLLLIAIILLLGILFYDYMPSGKTVPVKVQEYALQEDVRQELDKELNDINSEEVIKTYQLDASDIEVYEKTKEYNKGKVNPFAQYSTDTTGNNTSTGNNNVNNNNTNNNIDNNNESNGSFLNITGK